MNDVFAMLNKIVNNGYKKTHRNIANKSCSINNYTFLSSISISEIQIYLDKLKDNSIAAGKKVVTQFFFTFELKPPRDFFLFSTKRVVSKY